MTCPYCRSTPLVEIALHLGDRRQPDGTLTMHSCPACERRWWDRDGTTIALPSVLDLVGAR